MSDEDFLFVEYMGDGVYALLDRYYGIWLHTGSHDNPDNKVYLEPHVLREFDLFRERCKEQIHTKGGE